MYETLINHLCFQIRLDFTTFVITGPSTSTATVGKATFGIPTGEGKEFTYQTQCLYVTSLHCTS